jgi:hypothetical protein
LAKQLPLVAPTPRVDGPSGMKRSFAVTRTVTGTVAGIKKDGEVLVVTHKKGAKHELRADDKMKMEGGDKIKR